MVSAASRASASSKRASARRRKHPYRAARKERRDASSWAGMAPSLPDTSPHGHCGRPPCSLGLNHKIRAYAESLELFALKEHS